MPILAASSNGLVLPGTTTVVQPPSLLAVPNGLVAYWGFDRDSFNGPTSIQDLSGYNNSATTNGSPTFTDGVVGDAIQFASGNTTQYTQAAAQYSITYPFTIMAWVKFNTAPALGTFALFTIISGSSGTSDYVYLDFHGRVSGQTDVEMSAAASNSANVRTVALRNISTPTSLHHIAGVYSSATSFTLYIDGSIASGVTTTTSGTGAPNPASLTRINVGASNLGSTANFVKDAWVDEVKYYSRGLSAAEIYEIVVSSAFLKARYSIVSAQAFQSYEMDVLSNSRVSRNFGYFFG